MVVHSFQARM
jgi:hypothetical protein